MKNINDYTHMTREEFLRLVKMNGKLELCPSDFGLVDQECKEVHCECKECWRMATKDIRFRNDMVSLEEGARIFKEIVDEGDDTVGEFSKKDLKDGMVVEVRDGEFFLVLNDKIIGNEGYVELTNYDKELFNSNFNNLDIMGIFKSEAGRLKTLFEISKLKPIWQRPEVDWSKVEVDTKIEMMDANTENWSKYHFKSFDKNLVCVFRNGETSFTTTGGTMARHEKYARLYKKN